MLVQVVMVYFLVDPNSAKVSPSSKGCSWKEAVVIINQSVPLRSNGGQCVGTEDPVTNLIHCVGLNNMSQEQSHYLQGIELLTSECLFVLLLPT